MFKLEAIFSGDHFEYSWTIKVKRQDGTEDYTHLVDEGKIIKLMSFIIMLSTVF